MSKGKREVITKLLNLYAFSQAHSTVDIPDYSSMKISTKNTDTQLIQLHYKMVNSESIETTRSHSERLFKTYYGNIKRLRDDENNNSK